MVIFNGMEELVILKEVPNAKSLKVSRKKNDKIKRQNGLKSETVNLIS